MNLNHAYTGGFMPLHEGMGTAENHLRRIMDVRPVLKVLEGKRPSKGTSSEADEKTLLKA
jgi:hypothetical protein